MFQNTQLTLISYDTQLSPLPYDTQLWLIYYDTIVTHISWHTIVTQILWHTIVTHISWYTIVTHISWRPIVTYILWHTFFTHISWHNCRLFKQMPWVLSKLCNNELDKVGFNTSNCYIKVLFANIYPWTLFWDTFNVICLLKSQVQSIIHFPIAWVPYARDKTTLLNRPIPNC